MASLYVHIPFCKRRCKYCTFVSGCDYSLADAYTQCICKEAELRKKQYPTIDKLDTIFVGGGTPSSLGAERLKKILNCINTVWGYNDGYELTVECNPESVDVALADALEQCGVNRVSLGLQSSNNSTLSRIGRLHSVEQFDKAVGTLRNSGINNINADIILGLPESEQSFVDSIKYVCNKGVNHVSVYALEVHSQSVMHKEWTKGLYDIPTDEDYLCDLYDKAVSILADAGYHRYEVSNFAKEGYECRHNLTYWRGGNYLGLGCAAHWYMSKRRFANVTDTQKYIDKILQSKAVERCYERLDDKAVMSERLMLGLRLAEGVDVCRFQKDFGVDINSTFPKIKFMIDNGFIEQKGNCLCIVADKLYVLNSILSEIL